MAADGQVVFEISGDGKKAMASINSITKAMNDAGVKWEKNAKESTDGIGNSFTSLFSKIAAGAAAAKIGQWLTDFGKQAIQAASDLQEVQNVVDVTFGDGARQIEAWAQTAGTQFGLTETQAKKFTSTLGAMMKSAGLAGPEIVNMSTDLAGLAADMASFYNLDFETAFQKIRSGISGETEPLKQLGINMSVANLEAFALTQGITKAFDSMSQGEQTMLRYQYLMQATADAQGDFARTSDGFANATRMLETNLEQLKTNVGSLLLPVINGAVTGINGLLGGLASLTSTGKRKTVLDDFAEIDLKTSEKLAEINSVATEAEALIMTLDDLSGRTYTAENLTGFVDSLAGSVNGLDAAMTAAKEGDYSGTIAAIAAAMADTGDADAETWEKLLKAVGDNLPDVTDATGKDTSTADFLAAAADAAAKLGGEYPELWADFIDTLGGDAAGEMLKNFAGASAGAKNMEAFAAAGNALKTESGANWEALLKALDKSGNLSGLSGAGGNLQALADALNGEGVDVDRAEAWQTLLGALSENAEGLSKLTGKSAEETKAWLSELAEGANALDPSKAEGWDKLYQSLLTGLPGLEGTEFGAGLFEALGAGADGAEANLRALGIETDGIADKQAAWLDICRKLVQTIPGLSSIINTETGEVEGGTDAIRDYVREWQSGQEKLAMLKAAYAKRDALNQEYGDLNLLRGMAMYKANAAKLAREAYEAAGGDDALDSGAIYGTEAYRDLLLMSEGVKDAEEEAAKAQRELEKREKAAGEATEDLDGLIKYLGDDLEGVTETTEDAADAMTEWSQETKDAATEAVTAAADALEALDKYYQNVHSDTKRAVDGVVSGFQKITTPAEEAREKVDDLRKTLTETNGAEVNLKISDIESSIPTVQNMTAALQDQLDYLTQYQDYLAKARAAGVSDAVLGSLSDGSTQSFDYLKALATTGSAEEIRQLNDAYAQVEAAKSSLADSLTEQRLAADSEFTALSDAATAAVASLDQYATAEGNMEHTVQGIADGIAAKVPAVQAQVNALLSALSSLDGAGIFGKGLLGRSVKGSKFSLNLDGTHAVGLDYVPFDNYLAALHEGESVLTAEESRIWRNFKYGAAGSANGLDYDALGGVMRENVKAGGNVYLDGRTVGRVISDRQADSLRNLERSGWQG